MSRLFWALSIVAVVGQGPQVCKAEETRGTCAVPKTISMRDHLHFNAVAAAFRAFDVPLRIGFAIDLNEAPESERARQLTLEFEACTLEEALDRILQAHGGYRWEKDGDVYNILFSSPPALVERLEPLDRRIDRFSVRSVPLAEAERLLEQKLVALGATVLTSTVPIVVNESPTILWIREYKVTLSLEGLTARECLNRLIEAYPGHAHWRVGTSADGRLQIGTTIHESFGDYPANLTQAQFDRYVVVTDRLAELRGLGVARGLSQAETDEQAELRDEYQRLRGASRRRNP